MIRISIFDIGTRLLVVSGTRLLVVCCTLRWLYAALVVRYAGGQTTNN